MAGKMLGGTSSLNALALIPPSASDIDAWERLGDTNWNYKTLKPYLKGFYSLSEPTEDSRNRLDLGWSKESWAVDKSAGPVKACFAEVLEEGPLANSWIKAINGLGYPLTDDPFNGASTGPYNGASTIDLNTKTRVNSSVAYYKPVKDRKNLTVITAATVEKILLEQDGADGYGATGVQYAQGDEIVTAVAVKEVILCAGALQSPKLLELSGIGDAKILGQHSIGIKIDNPYVGTNLQDHLMHPISFETGGSFPTRDSMLRREPGVLESAMKDYTESRSGPVSTSAVTSFAYLPVDDFQKDSQERDRFLTQLSTSETKHPLDEHRVSVVRDLIQNGNEGTAQYFPYPNQIPIAGGIPQKPQEGSFLTIVVALSHPLSTGTVHIASSDPSAKPTIDHQYLSNPLDIELQARHVRYIEKLVTAEPMGSLLKRNGRRTQGPAAFIGDDLDKAKEYLGLVGTTNYHSCGTCAMAPRESGGVVDPELRVYGVKNLRVVDASVFPLIPQSNTQMLVYALAERAADIIKSSQ